MLTEKTSVSFDGDLPVNKCSINGCMNKKKARGLCPKHDRRVRIYGDVNKITRREDGSGSITEKGYLITMINGRNILLHVLIAEEVLKRRLRKGECVHHINENKLDNRNSNLLICDKSFHALLHRRMQAQKESGNPDYLRCGYCHKLDSPSNLYVRNGRKAQSHHRSCVNKYNQLLKHRLATHWAELLPGPEEEK